MHRTPLSLALVVGLLPSAPLAAAPVRVFILAGQSNMEGKGSVLVLENQLADPNTQARFAHLRRAGAWIVGANSETTTPTTTSAPRCFSTTPVSVSARP